MKTNRFGGNCGGSRKGQTEVSWVYETPVLCELGNVFFGLIMEGIELLVGLIFTTFDRV